MVQAMANSFPRILSIRLIVFKSTHAHMKLKRCKRWVLRDKVNFFPVYSLYIIRMKYLLPLN